MKKIFNWMFAAILICGTSLVVSSCGSDDDDDSGKTTTSQSKKYNVYASAVLDKNLAEFGYMEVTYTCKGKTETFKLKKGDASDQFPTANNFGSKVLNDFNDKHKVSYTNDNFIIRNIVLKDLSESDEALFKYKFVADPDHPALAEDANRLLVKPAVLGFVDGYFTQVLYNLSGVKVNIDRFDNWLTSQGNELPATFSPNPNK